MYKKHTKFIKNAMSSESEWVVGNLPEIIFGMVVRGLNVVDWVVD